MPPRYVQTVDHRFEQAIVVHTILMWQHALERAALLERFDKRIDILGTTGLDDNADVEVAA